MMNETMSKASDTALAAGFEALNDVRKQYPEGSGERRWALKRMLELAAEMSDRRG